MGLHLLRLRADRGGMARGPSLRHLRPARFRRGRSRTSVEVLTVRIAALVAERQELRVSGAATAAWALPSAFGAWSARPRAVWLLPAGGPVAGLRIPLAAASPSYWLVLLLVLVSGVGVAAYPPEGSKFAAYASGRRRASGMSLFSIGGNVGYALGPKTTTPLVLAFGVTGGFLVAGPVLGVAGGVKVLVACPS